MLKAAHIAVLIAGIVLCPMRCMGTFACDSTPSTTTKRCSCCRHSEPPAPTNSDQGDRPNECRCESCLCHGAVLPDDVVCLDLAANLVAIVVDSFKLESTAISISGDADSHPPFLRGGFDLRIAEQSLLL